MPITTPPPPADASTGQENSPSDKYHRLRAVSFILCAAVLFSTGPFIVHLTARDANQFLYTALLLFAQFLILIGFLSSFKTRFLNRHLPDRVFEFRYDALCRSGRWPLILIVIGGFDYVLFIWSTKFIATAVTTTVYELWPVFMIYGLAVYRPAHERKLQPDNHESRSGMTIEKIALTLFAAVGLLFMLGSQTLDDVSLSRLASLRSIGGILLALAASIVVATNVIGSIVYGKILHYHLTEEADPDQQNPRLLPWLSLLGMGISRLFTVLINLVLGFLISGSQGGFSVSAALGSIFVGASFVVGAIFLRIGNLGSASTPDGASGKTDLAINALFFCSPGLALVWLMTVSITIPRFDLFIVGSALILAINVLIQLKPDEERDAVKYGKEARGGTRLGFTAFIMSIWAFGAFIYIRDEIMPKV